MEHPEVLQDTIAASSATKVVLLVVLAGWVLLRGIVPAVSRIENDFAGYYVSAQIVVHGQDAKRLYDNSWFREQIRLYGLEDPKNPGKFAPFPPPTALLLVPLTPLQPLNALRVLVGIDVLCLILSILLVARMLSWSLMDAALFILCSGLGILSCLRFGQPYILVSACCLLGYYLYGRDKKWLAGVSLGAFVPVKYFPVMALACLAWRGEWKVILGGVLAILAAAAISIGVLGWEVHRIFLASVLGNHLTGHLSLHQQTVPFTMVYQSFDTLIDRLFVFDPTLNPQPLLDAPSLRVPSLVLVKGVLVATAAVTLVRLARTEGADALEPAIGMLGILVLLIAPATATYTFVLLWLPVALLVKYLLARSQRSAVYFVLGTYALIGFIPYGHTNPFDGHGGLTVIAYPRLFLILAMYIGAVRFLALSRPAKRDAHLPA
jgi:hypothetical protein